VRPDSAISAASEIGRRKNKSFAQYTGGTPPVRLYRMGLEQNSSAEHRYRRGVQGLNPNSLFQGPGIWISLGQFRGLPASSNHLDILIPDHRRRVEIIQSLFILLPRPKTASCSPPTP
jgi:hypothetical protein